MYKKETVLRCGESFISVRRGLERYTKEGNCNPELKRKIGYVCRQLKYKGRYIESCAGFLVVCIKVGKVYNIKIYEEG